MTSYVLFWPIGSQVATIHLHDSQGSSRGADD